MIKKKWRLMLMQRPPDLFNFQVVTELRRRLGLDLRSAVMLRDAVMRENKAMDEEVALMVGLVFEAVGAKVDFETAI